MENKQKQTKEKEKSPVQEGKHEVVAYNRTFQVGDVAISSNDPGEDLDVLIWTAKNVIKDRVFKNYLDIFKLKKGGAFSTSSYIE